MCNFLHTVSFILDFRQGSGKTTMIVDGMRKVNADGVTICDAHPDLEVFRLVQ